MQFLFFQVTAGIILLSILKPEHWKKKEKKKEKEQKKECVKRKDVWKDIRIK